MLLRSRSLPASDGSDDQKGFVARCNRVGKRHIGRFVRPVFLADEVPQERSAFVRDVITDRAPQHRIAGLQRVEDRSLRDRPFDFERHFGADMCQVSQVNTRPTSLHGFLSLLLLLRTPDPTDAFGSYFPGMQLVDAPVVRF